MIRRPPSSTLFPTPPLSRSLADPEVVAPPNRLRPPLSAGHALGTDEFGRDLMSRLVWGARVSLAAGGASAAAAVLGGGTPGVLRGFFTGWVETLGVRLTAILIAVSFGLLP